MGFIIAMVVLSFCLPLLPAIFLVIYFSKKITSKLKILFLILIFLGAYAVGLILIIFIAALLLYAICGGNWY